MGVKLQAIRGMNDILPEHNLLWHFVEDVIRDVVTQYGYDEIRCPIVESTDLFVRSVGETSDIVEKEMYTFLDRNGDSLTLRPEGTANCVRAAIQHGLLYNQTQRLWYTGPMFRHERPQRGRYRQFYQFGIEALGWNGPDIDAEVIAISARLMQRLGLLEHAVLQLNTLGSFESRAKYRAVITDYFTSYHDQLDDDSKRRLISNPLRILDSKNPDLKALINNAPVLMDSLDNESKEYFDALCEYLKKLSIPYVINPHLVRGLDYYCHMVFEWVTDKLGAQSTVGAGGRYDGLVEQLGGPATPAAGFGFGVDRIVNLLEAIEAAPPLALPDVYFIAMGNAHIQGMQIAEQLRTNLPSLRLIMQCGDVSFKAQMKKADKSGARYAFILGEDELAQNKITVKALREDLPQQMISIDTLVEFLKENVQ
jgi:histidyl-tRNA synthetase